MRSIESASITARQMITIFRATYGISQPLGHAIVTLLLALLISRPRKLLSKKKKTLAGRVAFASDGRARLSRVLCHEFTLPMSPEWTRLSCGFTLKGLGNLIDPRADSVPISEVTL